MSRKGSEVYSSDFDELSAFEDNELIDVFRRERDTEYGRNAVSVLISRYLGLVRKKASVFSGGNAESDDLAQEGLLAFMRAVESFDSDRGAKFSSFADVCVTNGIKNAAAKLSKNSGESLSENLEETAEDRSTPENIWFEKEAVSDLYKEIAALLSKNEWDIFRLYLGGASYGEIADKLGITPKSVDNAVFRVRKKLRSLL